MAEEHKLPLTSTSSDPSSNSTPSTTLPPSDLPKFTEEPSISEVKKSYVPNLPRVEAKISPVFGEANLAIAATRTRIESLKKTSTSPDSDPQFFSSSSPTREELLDQLFFYVIENRISDIEPMLSDPQVKKSITLDTQDSNGVDAVLLAVAMGHHSMIEMMLTDFYGRRGLLIAQTNHQPFRHQLAPLPFAVLQRDDAAVKLILEQENSHHTVLLGLPIEDDRNPLSMAAEKGETKIVKLILDSPKGSEALRRENLPTHGRTPLFKAAQNNHPEVVKLILNLYPGRETLTVRTKEGGTPLLTAVCGGNPQIVKLLLAAAESHDRDQKGENKGAMLRSMMQQDLNGLDVLCVAAYHQQDENNEIGIELLMHGADLSKAKTSAAYLENPGEVIARLDSIDQAYQAHRKQKAQKIITQIKRELNQEQGKIATLLAQLEWPDTAPNAAPFVHEYLKTDALRDLLSAKADSKKALSYEQQKVLNRAIKRLLEIHPDAVFQQYQGKTPLDLAMEIEPLDEEIIQLLHEAELQDDDAPFTSSLEHAGEDTESKRKGDNSLAISWRSLESSLQSKYRGVVRENKSKGPRPIQIDQVQHLFRLELTKWMVKAFAIQHKLVTSHNENRVGSMVSGGLSLLASLLPIPGASLAMDGVITASKFLINQAALQYTQRRDIIRHGHRVEGLENLDEAAERVNALAEGLARRFQLAAMRLDPESLPVFVKEVIRCTIKYWDSVMEKLSDTDKQALRYVVWNAGQDPVPPYTATELTPAQQRDNLIDNMLVGATFLAEYGIDSSALKDVSAGEGMIAEKVGSFIGGRQVFLLNERGDREKVMVREICQNPQAVAWMGEKTDFAEPVYSSCHLPAESSPEENKELPSNEPVKRIPPLCLSEKEVKLRGFTIDETTDLQLPILPPELTATRQQEQQEEEIAQLRKEIAELRAALEKTKKAESKEEPLVRSESSSSTSQSSVNPAVTLGLQGHGHFSQTSTSRPSNPSHQSPTLPPATETSRVEESNPLTLTHS